jgi:uncharacterized SAM-binding protein YcdF (DUF218 family)
VSDAARLLYRYLAMRTQPLSGADLVMGFGHFDPKVPRRCGELWRRGLVPRILFTGGVGAGSANLEQPEAIYFRRLLRERYPEIPDEDVLVEPDSTHTGENVTFSIDLLRRFDHGLSRVILVANAYRQRRVWLTCRHHLPDVHFENAPPLTSFDQERDMFAAAGEDFIGLLVGEVDRIRRYGALGYIAPCDLPHRVLAAYELLSEVSYINGEVA